jgi:hypothetical protein
VPITTKIPVAAALAVGLLGALLLGPAAAARAAPATTFFQDDRALLSSGNAFRKQALDQMSSLGADTVRVIVYWHDIARMPDRSREPGTPYPPGKLALLDELDRETHARGLKLLFTVSGPFPKWASKSRQSTHEEPRPALYGELMQTLGTRYKGNFDDDNNILTPPLPAVDYWGIWNEPNIRGFLDKQFDQHDRPHASVIYRHLFQKARAGLDASGSPAKVLIGETAPAGVKGSTGRGALTPLAFLRSMLCLNKHYKRVGSCTPVRADGWATHPYSFFQRQQFGPAPRDFVTVSTMGRLTRALRKAATQGATTSRLPVYVTEYGVQSFPDALVGVTLAQQAQLQSQAEYILAHTAGVASFSHYLLYDDAATGGGSHGGFETGLRFARNFRGGEKKPSYTAFRIPLAIKRQSSTRGHIWGRVRPFDPADSPPADSTVTIRYKDPGKHSHVAATLALSGRGYFNGPTQLRNGRRFQAIWSDGTHLFKGPLTAPF